MLPRSQTSLNAPYGARCFLTFADTLDKETGAVSLNAPYGARCFLTLTNCISTYRVFSVLMHLMALGAF